MYYKDRLLETRGMLAGTQSWFRAAFEQNKLRIKERYTMYDFDDGAGSRLCNMLVIELDLYGFGMAECEIAYKALDDMGRDVSIRQSADVIQDQLRVKMSNECLGEISMIIEMWENI